MSSTAIRVTFHNRSCAFVAGYGTREMLIDLRKGRPPVWSRQEKAWATQPHTARDLIALAESRGRLVLVNDPRQGALL
ncbi:hypothetical protein KUV85_06830 [Nocardioides panacisoli]|uniref:hypothetical protein n=1 Tax=Nocardioides panacisoli TaxID=627624 RepID=UPI001C63A9AE|nr:hypothetical protein [Nocardioides panacisoli]QYJ05388.1 hypothetical protein KUV85_06830 [Nocardioides panacisoli]